MDSIELTRLERRARLGYELARARRALVGVLPVLAIVGIAALLTHRPSSTVAFGLVTAAAGAFMLWYGRDPQRAVLPGVAAGLIPLVAALCANHFHHCGPDGCTSWCVPACTAGGVVAGIAVAWVGVTRRAGVRFWVSASGLALLTGAMGCACVGYSGVGGLALGYGVGVVPLLLRGQRTA